MRGEIEKIGKYAQRAKLAVIESVLQPWKQLWLKLIGEFEGLSEMMIQPDFLVDLRSGQTDLREGRGCNLQGS